MFLCEIKLKYFSAIGLIHNEILPKSPDWEYAHHRRAKPRTDNWQELSEAAVTRLAVDRSVVGGVVIHEAKEIDLFDLTKEYEAGFI